MGYNLKKRVRNIESNAELDDSSSISLIVPILGFGILTWTVASIFFARTLSLPDENIELSKPNNFNSDTNLKHSPNRNSFNADKLIERLRGELPSESTPSPSLSPPAMNNSGEKSEAKWVAEMVFVIKERSQWLELFPLGQIVSGTYKNIADSILSFVIPIEFVNKYREEGLLPSHLSYEKTRFVHSLVSGLLGVVFPISSIWPFWMMLGCGAYLITRYKSQITSADPILSVCDRKQSPFYSGIYGPLIKNATNGLPELSSFGLASPKLAKKSEALGHPLVKTLRQYNALNNTTLSLVRIILAYRNWPSFVPEDNINQENQEDLDAAKQVKDNPEADSQQNYSIEEYSNGVLPHLLKAHQTLQNIFNSIKQGVYDIEPNKNGEYNFDELSKILEPSTTTKPPLVNLLISSLTPVRARAISELSASLIATTYLATEAGKCLVFKQSSSGFTQITPLPHLQARAILHSIPSYHKEFNASLKRSIRQAILGSRRHESFGRPFLPEDMPISSRGLRDWLEILYSRQNLIQSTALITELEAHMDDIRRNWSKNFVSYIKTTSHGLENETFNEKESHAKHFDSGVIFKSVALIPQPKVIDIGLSGFSPKRLERIIKLLKHAEQLNKSSSALARLPGFKRQLATLESLETEPAVSQQISHAIAAKKWLIVQSMLTRFNWLATRVGDDGVPASGTVCAAIVCKEEELSKQDVISSDNLVPLRQRRLKEVLGENWEVKFFRKSPHPNDINVFDNKKKLKEFISSVKDNSMKETG